MKKPLKHRETTEDEPDGVPDAAPSSNRRSRVEPKLFIHYLPEGKGGPKEEKGTVPLELDYEAHIEERSDCEPGIYRIEKKRSGEFSGDVMFYTKEPLSRLRNVGRSVLSSSEEDDDTAEVNITETDLPGERLLRSLEGKTDGGRVVVIAKRKADPVGMSFRHPCSTDCTIGEVPYDEADPSIDALELSIQKLYGGGRYEIIVRQDGETVGSVVRTIADPVESRREREDGPPVRAVVPATPAVPTKSPVDELKTSVSVFKEVAAALNNLRPAEPERETPLETLKNALSLVKDLNPYLTHSNGVSDGDGSGSSVRDWMDGIASIGREFGLGQMLNNVVIYGLHAAAQKQQVGEAPQPPAPASQQAMGAAAAGSIGVPAAAEPNKAPPTVLPAAPVWPVPEPSGAAADTRGAIVAGFSLEMLPPPMRVALDNALSVFVSEMQRSELSDEHETEKAEMALREFVEAFPQGYMVLDYFMQQSSARVLMYLSSFKPEWESVVDLKSAPGFIEVVQEEWAAAKTPDAFVTERVESEDRLEQERAN